MDQTLKLTSIARKWRDILAASPELKAFCQEKYGKNPSVFFGINGDRLPDQRNCPAIFVLPSVKHEGLEEEEYSYGIPVSWVITQRKVIVDGVEMDWNEKITGENIEFVGAVEVDEFGQLIYEVLCNEVSDISPISSLSYSIEPRGFFPQFPGFALLTTMIVPTFGEPMKYE